MKGILALFTLLLLFSSCSSFDQNDNEYKASSEDLAQYMKKGPNETVKETREIIDKALEERLEFYAKRHYSRSKKLLKQASELVDYKKNSVGENKKAFYSKIALSQRYIQKGYYVKKIIDRELVDVFRLDKDLKKLKAPVEFVSEYSGLKKQILKMMSDIEVKRDKYQYENRASLIIELKGLKSKLVIKHSLRESRKVIAKIRAEELTNYAVKSYKKALSVYKKSKEFIKKNFDDNKSVEQISNAAQFEAEHAYYTSKEVKKMYEFVGIDDVALYGKFEDIVIDIESYMWRISQSLGGDDVRNRTLARQSSEISKVAKDVKTNNERLKIAISTLKESQSRVVASEAKIESDTDVTSKEAMDSNANNANNESPEI